MLNARIKGSSAQLLISLWLLSALSVELHPRREAAGGSLSFNGSFRLNMYFSDTLVPCVPRPVRWLMLMLNMTQAPPPAMPSTTLWRVPNRMLYFLIYTGRNVLVLPALSAFSTWIYLVQKAEEPPAHQPFTSSEGPPCTTRRDTRRWMDLGHGIMFHNVHFVKRWNSGRRCLLFGCASFTADCWVCYKYDQSRWLSTSICYMMLQGVTAGRPWLLIYWCGSQSRRKGQPNGRTGYTACASVPLVVLQYYEHHYSRFKLYCSIDGHLRPSYVSVEHATRAVCLSSIEPH